MTQVQGKEPESGGGWQARRVAEVTEALLDEERGGYTMTREEAAGWLLECVDRAVPVVPRAVAERLAEALEAMDSQKVTLPAMRGTRNTALAEYREAYPKSDRGCDTAAPGAAITPREEDDTMSDVNVAEARQSSTDDGWYVYWETPAAYGARGNGLSQAAAEALARRLLSGEETP